MLWVGIGGHGCAHVMLWVGMGGHRSLLMGMVWVWVQTRRTMLGFATEYHEVTLMMGLLSISVTWYTPHSRVSDPIMHMTQNTINGVLLNHSTMRQGKRGSVGGYGAALAS
jgi:hypothetical protein